MKEIKIVKAISSEIEEFLTHNKIADNVTIEPIAAGNRSTVYKLNDYCYKTYTSLGRIDGESECQALLTFQSSNYVPKLFAYLPGRFVLTEWIDGLNLIQY